MNCKYKNIPIRELIEQGYTVREIARKYNISEKAIYNHIDEETKSLIVPRKNQYTEKIKPRLKEVKFWLENDFEIGYICEKLGISTRIFYNYANSEEELRRMWNKNRRMRKGRANKGTTRASREPKRTKQALYDIGLPAGTRLVDVETYSDRCYIRMKKALMETGLTIREIQVYYEATYGDDAFRLNVQRIEKLMDKKETDIILIRNLMAIPQTELAFKEGKSKPTFYKYVDEFRYRMCIVYMVDERKIEPTAKGYCSKEKREYLRTLLGKYNGFLYTITEKKVKQTAEGIKLAYNRGVL